RYIFREYPHDQPAVIASMLARSVGKDRYFFVIETLFRQQRQWVANRIQPLMTLATKEFGFTEQSFKASLANQELLDAIQAARDRANKVFWVELIPTFFINGRKVSSYQTMKQMEQLIDPLLKG